MNAWQRELRDDPLPWLLERDDPGVRHMALRLLLDLPDDDADVRQALHEAMRSDPIATILDHQHPDGYWVKPGAGYAPKYTGTVWSLMFLDQLGADGNDSRVRRACEYVLAHTQAKNGGFGSSGRIEDIPPPSRVVHCLNGNLLRTLIGFGWLDDRRVQCSIDWEAQSITGDGFDDYHGSGTSGPGFRCGASYGLPCAWGAVKALRALARVPETRRSAQVATAIEQGVEFLLSRDPCVADYPAKTGVSPNWLKPGFPSGYIADSLQVAEVLAELGYAQNPRLANTVAWILSLQDDRGRWRNQYAYHGKLWQDIEKQGAPSKWVTLRACTVLRRALP